MIALLRRLLARRRADPVIDAAIAQAAPRVVWLGDGARAIAKHNRRRFERAERQFRAREVRL